MTGKDPRVTVRKISLKYYAGVFLFLVTVSYGLLNIYLAIEKDALPADSGGVEIPFLIFLVLITLLTGALIELIRNFAFYRPLRRLSDAARRVAGGDFSVRVTPMRKDGKRLY